MIPRFSPIITAWGPVIGAQFRQDVLDSALDGFFGNGKLIRNLFVGTPSRNQPQDSDFRWRQSIVSGMLGELVGSEKMSRALEGKTHYPAWT